MIDKDLLNRNRNINSGYRKLDKVKAQIEDSIFSVHSNIAEGHCRRHLKENIQFNTISLSSLGESYSQIFALLNSDDIDKKWFDEYDQRHYSLENKLINFNKSFIIKLNNGEWNKDYQ